MLMIYERALGLDHYRTAHSYGNLALFYRQLNQVNFALVLIKRAYAMSALVSEIDSHPDSVNTLVCERESLESVCAWVSGTGDRMTHSLENSATSHQCIAP